MLLVVHACVHSFMPLFVCVCVRTRCTPSANYHPPSPQNPHTLRPTNRMQISIFLTQNGMLDPNLALGLYVKTRESDWVYRGCVHNAHPSEALPLQVCVCACMCACLRSYDSTCVVCVHVKLIVQLLCSAVHTMCVCVCARSCRMQQIQGLSHHTNS